MQITMALLAVSIIISIVVYALSKKLFKTLVVFSVLANLIFLINIDSGMFILYNIKWLKYFSALLWPIINIILIIKYFQNKK
jgi:TRAP-type C4-dicarboxylate transport system permease small subunit